MMVDLPSQDALHWGSLVEDDPIQDSIDTIINTKTNWSFFEVPPLHQPCSAQQRSNKKDNSKRALHWLKSPVDSQGQNYMLQSIELQHYKRRMRYMLAAAHAHQSELSKGNPSDTTLPSPPPPPKRFCSSEGHLSSKLKTSFLSEEYDVDQVKSSFSSGQPYECPIHLDSLSARQLLLKSVAGVCAHSGFECSSDTALNTMTDVVVEQMQKLCRLLKTDLERHDGTDAVIVLDHVLKECGQESVLSLENYWDTRVRQVALALEKEDLELLEEYNKLKDSSLKPVPVTVKGERT